MKSAQMTSEIEFGYFCDWARTLKRKNQLHPVVENRLAELLRSTFPESTAVLEVGAIKGGRNDLLQYFQDGRKAVWELFFSPTQVAQDLRLLEQADATWRFAVLLDDELSPDLAKTYFRKRPDAYPYLWLSQVMMPSKEAECVEWLKERLSKVPEPDVSKAQVFSINGGQGNIIAGGDVNIDRKKVVRPKIVREEGDASEHQVKEVADLIRALDKTDQMAGKPVSYGGWMARLKNRYKVESYRKLTVPEATDAVSWLKQELGRKLPSLRRTDHGEWARRVMTAIWAAARELGMDHNRVHAYATEYLEPKKPIRSLKELGERDLEKLRDRLRRMRR